MQDDQPYSHHICSKTGSGQKHTMARNQAIRRQGPVRPRRAPPRRHFSVASHVTGITSVEAPEDDAVPPVAPPPNEEGPPTPWKKSNAKKQLQEDILSGRVQTWTGPQVYFSRTIYQRYAKGRFCSNFYRLRGTVQTHLEVADVGRRAVDHDVALLDAHRVEVGGFHYNGSAIQKQLRHDVAAGYTDNKTAKQVLAFRPLYEQSGLSIRTFSNHLFHERRRLQKRAQAEAFHERMEFVTAEIIPHVNADTEQDNQLEEHE